MAEKNIQMTQRNSANTGWDNLFPKTKAAQVTLLDSSGYFVASTVEDAMKELFQNVSNGKNLIATAITDKGVPASGGETHAQLAQKVGEISTEGMELPNNTDLLQKRVTDVDDAGDIYIVEVVGSRWSGRRYSKNMTLLQTFSNESRNFYGASRYGVAESVNGSLISLFNWSGTLLASVSTPGIGQYVGMTFSDTHVCCYLNEYQSRVISYGGTMTLQMGHSTSDIAYALNKKKNFVITEGDSHIHRVLSPSYSSFITIKNIRFFRQIMDMQNW